MSEQLAFDMAEVGLDVPQGYKRTEVGVIPEDWNIYSLPDVIWYQEGPGLRKWQFRSKGLKVINVTNLQENGFLDLERTDRHISWEEFEKQYKHFACDEGDLVIASSGNSYCKASIVRSCDLPLLMNTSVIRFKPVGTFSKNFMEIYMKSWHFKDQIDLLITGGAQPNFGPFHLNKIKIVAPVHPTEQTAIATALSDVDALINELEQLIAKKQAIKTATMQQLLTGRTRLPQFALREDGTPKGYKTSELGEIPEDWDICLLQDAVDFLDGLRRPVKSSERSKIQGTYPYYGASGIVDYVNDYLFDDELILLGEDGENILSRNLPLAFQVSGKIWVNNHAHVMKPKAFFNITYLTSYLESLDYSLLNSGTAQPKLNKQSCLKIKINNPSFQEQTAIASILTDMDSDISSLQQRLSKTRQIKQGMMQELLTGKTRLIPPPDQVQQ